MGIYLLGVSLTWINPASPGWPTVVVKALACRAAQIAGIQGGRRMARQRPKTEAHDATKIKTEGGDLPDRLRTV